MITRSTLRHAVLFGLSLLALQGTAYLLQLEAAARLDVGVFDQIRVVESIIGVLSMVQTLGVPSASLARLAASDSEEQRRRIATSSAVLVLALSAIASVIYFAAQGAGAVSHLSTMPTWAVLTLSSAVALRLNFVSITQGQQQFSRLAGASVFSGVSACATTIVLRMIGVRAEDAWIASRIVLELGLCVGLVALRLREAMQESGDARNGGVFITSFASSVALFRASLPIGLSLLLRAAIEHGPVLLLADIHSPKEVIGVVGLVLTLGAISMMPSGVLLGALLPSVASQLKGRPAGGERRGLLVRQILAFGALPALVMLAGLIVGPLFLPILRDLAPAIIGMAVLLVWLKSMTSALGAYLLAAHLGKSIMVINAIVGAVGLAAVVWVRGNHLVLSAGHALAGIVALEIVSVALYVAWTLLSGSTQADLVVEAADR